MRIREIKPSFWLNEQLADCSRDARLMFIGLWQIADRAGFFPDKPRKIRASLYPYEPDADVEKWLAELSANHLIRRYENDGQAVWHVVNFEVHQRPHIKERESDYRHLAPKSRGKVGASRGKVGASTGFAGINRPAPSAPFGDGKETLADKSADEPDADAGPIPPPPPKRPKATATQFETFWQAYPKRSHRKAAWAAWAKIHADQVPAVMAGLKRWLDSRQWRDGYRHDPATWLNGERWTDETIDTEQVKPNAAPDPYAHLPRAPRFVVGETP